MGRDAPTSEAIVVNAAGSTAHRKLPPFQLSWGEVLHGEDYLQLVKQAFHEVVRWIPNIFPVPLGAAGKKFVVESTRLIRAFAEGSALESVALWALMLMPSVLLQQPARSSSHRQRVDCLERRLAAWSSGRIEDLLREGRVLQADLRRRMGHRRAAADEESSRSRAFARLMLQGKVKAALRLLSSQTRGQVLNPNDSPPGCDASCSKSVLDVLREKHPSASPIDPSAVLDNVNSDLSHPVIFEKLTADSIRNAALHCQGAAGPSALDAGCWRRCTMFHGASKHLCNAIAAATKRLCTVYLDPCILQPFIACRLIPLSKNPGVRPIGICDTLRRIMGKAILSVLGPTIQDVVGTAQLCAKQRAGCEAAVHAIQELWTDERVHGILLVDASNAFNSLNRAVMLQNIQATCPSLATSVINLYRGEAELFVGDETLFSREGTTQGDPLSMAVYALSTLPLISKVSRPDLSQTWFADDACGGSTLTALHSWWSSLSTEGPKFGYHVNPPKTWLLVKEDHLQEAKEIFNNSGIQITTDGRPLLGAPIGCPTYTQSNIQEKVVSWIAEVKVLASFAATRPQAAYAAFTHGFASKWSYLARACDGLEELLAGLESVIRREFLPSITGRAPSDSERALLGLPARLGGLGVADPSSGAISSHKRATQVTKPLVERILGRCTKPVAEVFRDQLQAVVATRKARATQLKERAATIKSTLPPSTQRAVIAAEEKGASNWLTALPISDFGFSLSKADFRDAIHIRYGWTPPRLPAQCVCGNGFSVDHALSCSHGGYLGLRHNEIRDLLSGLLEETCANVGIEPVLQPLDGEQLRRSANTSEGARVDIKAGGFWGASRHDCAFFDVRVFYPHARSYKHRPLQQIYRSQEADKRRLYAERIQLVDRGSFTPLVFSSSGGAGPAATTFLKRLADKKDTSYAQTMGWLRCRLSFALLRSSILCLRGCRSKSVSSLCGQPELRQPDLALSEAQVSLSQ